MGKVVLYINIFIILVSAHSALTDKCGYESCNLGMAGKINVHIVPHTHDDVGYVKTVDEYFYGSQNRIDNAGVQYIIDTAISALLRDPSRRFTYVEMAFFYRWWKVQDESMRTIVRELVNQGRLQFTLGGWSMADEACTHYSSVVDEHTLGLRFLDQEFGQCGRPLVAWQIDPFGHSREFANIFSQMGYDAFILRRIDYEDKAERLISHELDLLWQGSILNSSDSLIFTDILFRSYGAPMGFQWDVRATDTPIMDDPDLEDYNADDIVDQFLKMALDQASYYPTSNIMVTMGGDFTFQGAESWFKNMDKLITHVNARIKNGSQVYALYSTPACYAHAIYQERPTQWKIKYDDFLPYASRPNGYWTGFYTSRPALKRYERLMSGFLQAVSQLNTMAGLQNDKFADKRLFLFREALGVVQHHDGVSGTEQQHVAFDYARRLSNGAHAAEGIVQEAYQVLMRKEEDGVIPQQFFCWLANESICNFTTDTNNGTNFMVTIYNPLSHQRNYWVRVPVIYDSFNVIDPDGKSVVKQIIPINNITKHIWASNLYNSSLTKAKYELVFRAIELPSLGWRSYKVLRATATRHSRESVSKVLDPRTFTSPEEHQINNKIISLKFDPITHLLKTITKSSQDDTVSTMTINQTLQYYVPYDSFGQVSGAYIFRPVDDTPVKFPTPSISYVKGPLVHEVYQVFGKWAAQIFRLYNGDDQFEVEWTIGPIDISGVQGKEVISLYQSTLKNDKTFWTDSNGRQMMKRIVDYRPTWNFTVSQPVAGNYYPVNTGIYIQDQESQMQLTILTDRTQGGSSVHEGEIELMIHRRLLRDDGLGVREPLNEKGIGGRGLVARGTHYIFVDSIENSAKHQRKLANQIFYTPLISFSQIPTVSIIDNWSGLATKLPENLQIMTLQQWKEGSALLRIEHYFQPGEDLSLSKNSSLNIMDIFKTIKISGYDELTLGANIAKEEWKAQKLKWNESPDTDSNIKKGKNREAAPNDLKYSTGSIVLQPSEIQTLMLKLNNV